MGFSPSLSFSPPFLLPFLATYFHPVQGKSSGFQQRVSYKQECLGRLAFPLGKQMFLQQLKFCEELPLSLGGTRIGNAYLRAVDVKILQQLVVVNEGIEAVKWLLEEKSTLTSRCSSLTSSQYSLVESQEASRRGSWDSVQDPNDKLDSISIGSYLDTLADDMDEYSQNAAEPATASAPGRALARAEQDWARIDHDRGLPAKQEKGKAEHEWPHADHLPAGLPQDWSCPDQQRFAKEPQVANGYLGKQPSSLEPGKDTKLLSGAGERMGKGNPGGKARKAEADFENCKLNSKARLEYDAHWRWLQSQDDVTFL
uniref:Leucine rich adaptor protein 1 n=1 Tax=Dromaius novaehollandiae TaxID=8790 RepID=A0A8C4JSZ2_DRONO